MDMLRRLDRRGCTLIDTTCGSVLNVWKNVRRYAEQGYTSIIHGKVWHEETQATASQAVEYGGRFLVVFDDAETAEVCDYIRQGGDPAAFLARLRNAVSPGFDPDRDLQRIGLANQTTMLMSESLRVAETFKAAMRRPLGRRGARRSTIRRSTPSAAPRRIGRTPSWRCCASDAVDLMVVIGGYNSSNTCNLARICADHVSDVSHRRSRLPGLAQPRFVIARSGPRRRRSRRPGCRQRARCRIGLTSGASTPDNLVGAAVARLASFCADAMNPQTVESNWHL